MFKRMVKYKILGIIRQKSTVFWLLIFPILLSLFFYASLKNMLSGESFETINIAVVNEGDYDENGILESIIKSVSVENEKDAKDNTLFVTQYITREEAEKKLGEKKISGYIYFDNGSHLIIKKNGIDQTIIKAFLDIAIQKSAIVNEVAKENGGDYESAIKIIGSETSKYITDTTNGSNKPDTSVQFFYSIMGMACMYGASSGCMAIYYLQANQSSIAKRNCMAPVSKMKQMLTSFISYSIINVSISLLLLLFIWKVLDINFGDRYGLIALTSVVGSMMGLSFGFFIGAVTKFSISVKNNLVVGISMLCSYMAGMMDNTIKYTIKKNAFIVDRLNPVNLITESYYKLYYYSDLSKYYENIVILLSMTVILLIFTVSILLYQERNTSKNIMVERGADND